MLRGVDTLAEEALRYMARPDVQLVRKLEHVGQMLNTTPSYFGVAEAIAGKILREFQDDAEGDLRAYPCRLCECSYDQDSELRDHIASQHASFRANDTVRAYVEYRKKVLGLLHYSGPKVTRAVVIGGRVYSGRGLDTNAHPCTCQAVPWSLQRGLIAKFDEELRTPGRERLPRELQACVVCARLLWKDTLSRVILFPDMDDPEEVLAEAHVARDQQTRLCEVLGTKRYAERWKHIVGTEEGRAELLSSAVRHPFFPEEFLLLHKAAMAEPLTSGQPVCASCKSALLQKPLMLPRFALANDLWIGRCPLPLRDLQEGTKRLLPMIRACVQVTVLQPAGVDQAQRQRGFIGNSIFVPQATPSKIQKVLPPSPEEIQSTISYVLVDSQKRDLRRATMLSAPRAEYEAAVKCLQTTSLFYAQSVLDPRGVAENIAEDVSFAVHVVMFLFLFMLSCLLFVLSCHVLRCSCPASIRA